MKDFRKAVEGERPTTVIECYRRISAFSQPLSKCLLCRKEPSRIRFDMEKYGWTLPYFVVWHVLLPATYYQMIPDCPPLSPKITPLRNWV